MLLQVPERGSRAIGRLQNRFWLLFQRLTARCLFDVFGHLTNETGIIKKTFCTNVKLDRSQSEYVRLLATKKLRIWLLESEEILT